jgi:hypothetical protein
VGHLVSRGGRRVDDCGPDDRLIETRRKKETGKKRWAARLPPGASVVSSQVSADRIASRS